MKRLSTRRTKLHTIFMLTSGITVFLGIFLLFYVYTNWSAFQSELAFATKKPTPSPTATVTITPSPVPTYEPAHIMIEKIGVDTPLHWNVAAEDTLTYLDKGVAHLKGTAAPGQIGNMFVTGHSSDYVWKRNPYAAVFALLPKLAVGDSITIREHGKAYVYKVAQTKIVDPDHVEVAQPTTTPVLTLMTCYPIGSTKQRYIIHATLVSSPEKPVASNQDSFTAPTIQFR